MTENVLVTTAGTIVGQGIIKCLKLSGRNYWIATCDHSPEAAGLYRGNLGQLVPLIASPDYADSIIKICRNENIRAIFLGADEELEIISREQKRIEKETDAQVITNPPRVIETCVDKWKTFQFLKENGIPCPESSLFEDEFFREHKFPLIVKPRQGHGSLHLYVVNSKEEADYACKEIEKAGWSPMIQEYVKNADLEFTSGITMDRDGKHVMSSISMKRTLKSGQTYKAFIDDFPEVRKISEKIALKIGATGPLNVQGRLSDSQELETFEINPRFSASCPLRAAAGVNEPDLVYRSFVLGEEIKKVEKYKKLVALRYWNELYVPAETYEITKNEQKIAGNDSFILDYF